MAKKTKDMSSYHVGVAAEAFAAAVFARFGYDVLVQYGADQPVYDLMVTTATKELRISVKGSQDGSWGLTQSYKKGRSYKDAVNFWQDKQGIKTVFCFVQFQNVSPDQLPRMYLATTVEVAHRLRESAGGRGETILYEKKEWTKRAQSSGTIDRIPEDWKLTRGRIEELMGKLD